MKKSEFIHLIESPNNIGGTDIIGLQEVIQEFPYFQSGQLLLTKAYHQSENFNFEIQLKKAAAYASDRKQLHKLIFDPKQKNESINSSDSNQEIANEFNKEEIGNIEPIESQSQALDKDKPQFVPDFNLVSDDKSDENKPHESPDILEQQILTEVIHQSILLEVDDNLAPIEDYKTEDGEKNETPISFDQNTEHSFSEWLSYYSDENSSDKNTNLLWDKISEESRNTFDSFKPESTLPVKQEFYSASKMAKLSIQEDDDLVTETLAMIYADQAYPEKAIKAFKKLQLKYPEKRVYFAGRIKEIENQINL